MNPDDLRVQVHGARWYKDPLPADKIAPATEEKWPSVTTIRKAWAKPYRKRIDTVDEAGMPAHVTVPLDAYWVAEYALDNIEFLTGLPREKAMTQAATAGGRTLGRAADRGSAIHAVLEDLAMPDVIVDEMMVPDEARPYVEACRAFVADCQPKWLLSEFVVYNRGVGFAGTGDAILEIEGTRYLTDWKSRGGEHGAYGEEAAQIGGYSMAEYAIGAEGRFRLPHIDAGLIVSITAEDGYRLYPVDLVKGAEAFVAMRECWEQHREGTKVARQAIGDATPLVDTAGLAMWLTSRIAWIRDGYPDALQSLAASWPLGVPTLKQGGHSMGQLREIARAVTAVETKHQLPF